MTIGYFKQYITYNMKNKYVRKRFLILIIILSFVTATLFAGKQLHDGFGLSLETSWYGSIPSAFHEDPLPLRSHLTFGGSLTPAIMGLGDKLELTAGISSHYVTHSLFYGTTVWHPFFVIGPHFNLTIHIDPRFSISPGITFLAGFYTQTKEFTPLVRLSVTGGYTLPFNLQRNQWIITLPINVDLRTDYVSVSAGVGITWRIDKRQKQEKL